MDILIRGMRMPKNCSDCPLCYGMMECSVLGIKFFNAKEKVFDFYTSCTERHPNCPLVPIPEHGRLRKRIVNRGDVFNAIEAERINSLDGIFTDRYKDGFHDGLKRALEILANDVQDVPTIIEAEEGM